MEDKNTFNIGKEALVAIAVVCGTAVAGMGLRAYEVAKGKVIKRKRQMRFNFETKTWEYVEDTTVDKTDNNVVSFEDHKNKKGKNNRGA